MDFTVGLLSGAASAGLYALQGLADEGRRQKCRLVYFSGALTRRLAALSDKDHPLFGLIGPESVDGLIVTGSMSHHMDQAEFQRFLDRYDDLPLVTVSVEVPGRPSVVYDNKAGMAGVVAHLLDDHKLTRLAFIGGPPGQQEAEQRREAFVEALKARGLEPEPRWLVYGDYTPASGTAAAQELLALGLEGCQGVVAANDTMAMAAMEVFQARGLRIPQDLALAGFDDHPKSRSCDPPLTTAAQSFYDQSVLAAQTLAELLRGQPVPARRVLQARLVRRQSCGCPARAERQGGIDARVEAQAELETFERLRQEEWRQYQLQLTQGKIVTAGERLFNSLTPGELHSALTEEARGLGLGQGGLSLFEEDGGARDRLVLTKTWPGPPVGTFPAVGGVCPAREFVPGGLRSLRWNRDLLVVQALVSRDQFLGLAFWDTSPERADLAVTLGKYLAAGLAEHQLLANLRQAQAHLVQSEKMSALGGLVAGVAHEINTPLGIAVTAASYLENRLDELERLTASGQLSRSALESFLSRSRESADLVLRNLDKAHSLIQGFKRVAADQASEERRSFAVTAYCREVLASLKPRWKNRSLELLVEGPDDLTMDSYPGALSQVLTNLLLNGLVHAYGPEDTGRLGVKIQARPRDRVQIEVWDEGRGIAPEHKKRLFEPFFTTKRGEGGTGLGLHVSFNLVTGPLGGRISCDSQLGRGTRFRLDLPRVRVDGPQSLV